MRRRDRQPLGVHRQRVLRHRRPVDRRRDQPQRPAVEPQVGRRVPLGVAPEPHPRPHPRTPRRQPEAQRDLVGEEVGRRIVGEPDGRRVLRAHGSAAPALPTRIGVARPSSAAPGRRQAWPTKPSPRRGAAAACATLGRGTHFSCRGRTDMGIQLVNSNSPALARRKQSGEHSIMRPLILASLVLIAAATPGLAQQVQKPNVVFILADNWGTATSAPMAVERCGRADATP